MTASAPTTCRCTTELVVTKGAAIVCPHCDSPCLPATACPKCDLLRRTCNDCGKLHATPVRRGECENSHRFTGS